LCADHGARPAWNESVELFQQLGSRIQKVRRGIDPDLYFEFVYWWDWSSNDEVKFQLKEPVAGQTSIILPMSWEDTWTYAIGLEYVIKPFDRDISLRGGFMYEECPVPDETVSPVGFQGDNLLYNIGLGSMIGPVYCDFFFTHVQTKDCTWNNANKNLPNPGVGQISGEFSDYNTIIFGNNITFKF
jgi:long-subunit fatty acid transport protein